MSGVARKIGWAVAIAILCVHLFAAVFVRFETEAALQAMVQHTPPGRVLLWSLLLYHHRDDESDIIGPNLSHDALLYRCRDRANLVLLRDGPTSVALLGLLLFWRRLQRTSARVAG